MNQRTLELIEAIKALNLPIGDYAIFGSGPMVIHGLKENAHDIDIIARGAAWEAFVSLAPTDVAPMGDKRVLLFNDQVEVFNGWKPAHLDADALIHNAEMIDDLPWVRLEQVLQYKQSLNRPKDQEDIQLLEAYFATHHHE